MEINLLSFVRSYFLYLYYWFSIKRAEKENDEPAKFSGFCVVLGIFVIGVLGLWWGISALFPESTSELYKILNEAFGRMETHKGEVSVGLFLLLMPISVIFCYFICCVGISFEKIPARLKKHEFLGEFAWWKLLTPYFMPLLILLIYMLIG